MLTVSSKLRLLAFLLSIGSGASAVTAQCGTQWLSGLGARGAVHAFATMPNGDLIAGGEFIDIGGVNAVGIARRIGSGSGAVWQPIGGGVAGTVLSLAVMPNGDLIAGGQFARAGGVAASNIARWDGVAWSPLGAGVDGSILSVLVLPSVHALLVLSNGDLVATGHFVNAGGSVVNHIARWDGSAWFDFNGGMAAFPLAPLPVARALVELPNGDFVVAGQFPGLTSVTLAHSIARWNGTAWAAMNVGWPLPQSSAADVVRSLLVLPNGDLIASGSGGSSVPVVARWNGAAWLQLGGLQPTPPALDGSAIAMSALPDGDLVVAGRRLTSSGGTTNQLLRRTGGAWVPIGGGHQGDVHALATTPSGQLAVGGNFTSVGGAAIPAFAELASACPATVSPVGTGCIGSGGPNVLAALSLPWLGSTFRTVATGMPTNAIVGVVTSFSPATVPLSMVLPVGGACDGLVQVDSTQLLLPTGGQAATQWSLPNDPVFAGITLHQHVAVLELSPSGNVLALTGTNRLVLSTGIF